MQMWREQPVVGSESEEEDGRTRGVTRLSLPIDGTISDHLGSTCS